MCLSGARLIPELLCNWQSVSQPVSHGLDSLCNSWPDFTCSWTITGLMSCGVLPDGRTGLSSLLDPLLESSLDSLLESSLLDPLLEYSSLNQSELLATDSQSVRLGSEPLLVCLCVTLSLSRLYPVCIWVCEAPSAGQSVCSKCSDNFVSRTAQHIDISTKNFAAFNTSNLSPGKTMKIKLPKKCRLLHMKFQYRLKIRMKLAIIRFNFSLLCFPEYSLFVCLFVCMYGCVCPP
jgi:hypothetical protein